jgi:uncharacterized protein DUF1573
LDILGDIMKKLVFALILLLLAGSLNAANKIKKDEKKKRAPRLEVVGGFDFNWGVVSPDDGPIDGFVYLKNVGDTILNITRIKPGCSCTSETLENDVLEPGDSTKLSFSLRFGSSVGKVQKIIQIYTDDPRSNHRVLFLKADVQIPITPYPDKYFRLKTMELDVPKTAHLTLKNTTDTDITITDLVFEDDRRQPTTGIADVQMEIPAGDDGEVITKDNDDLIGTVIKAGGQVKISLTTTATKYGRKTGNCVLKFDNKKQDQLRIYFFGKVDEPEEMPYETSGSKSKNIEIKKK